MTGSPDSGNLQPVQRAQAPSAGFQERRWQPVSTFAETPRRPAGIRAGDPDAPPHGFAPETPVETPIEMAVETPVRPGGYPVHAGHLANPASRLRAAPPTAPNRQEWQPS